METQYFFLTDKGNVISTKSETSILAVIKLQQEFLSLRIIGECTPQGRLLELEQRIGLAHQLQEAIKNSQLSTYQLAQQAGITRSQIGRFLSNQFDLKLKTASKVANVLGLKLVKK